MDILDLVNHGHAGDLVATVWMPRGISPIEMVQLRTSRDGCIKFRDGRCSINDIKPSEGVMAHHDRVGYIGDSITYSVARTWLLPRNRRLVRHLISLVTQTKTTPILL